MQCGEHVDAACLNYVCGYASKASYALAFKSSEYKSAGILEHTWLSTHRLLTKRAPLLPAMAADLCQLPLMVYSFQLTPLYAPVPHYVELVNGQYLIDGQKQQPQHADRFFYHQYLRRAEKLGSWTHTSMSFLEVARVARYDGAKDAIVPRVFGRGRYAAATTCSIGVRFVFELLAFCVGQWCATSIPHAHVQFVRWEFCCSPGEAPEGARMYRAARLSGTNADGAVRAAIRASVATGLPEYSEYPALEAAGPDEARRLVHQYLRQRMIWGLRVRCAKDDRIATFVYHMHGVRCLADAFEGVLTV